MNEALITQHNSVVKPGDIHYNLGDVFFGDQDKFKKDWPKFNGSKRLIVGNHDDIRFLSSGGFFKKVQLWRMFSEFQLMFSHVPLHESSLLRKVTDDLPYPDNCKSLLHVHGHIHRHPSPPGPYYNVCVEVLNNYTPIHIEELALIASKL